MPVLFVMAGFFPLERVRSFPLAVDWREAENPVQAKIRDGNVVGKSLGVYEEVFLVEGIVGEDLGHAEGVVLWNLMLPHDALFAQREGVDRSGPGAKPGKADHVVEKVDEGRTVAKQLLDEVATVGNVVERGGLLSRALAEGAEHRINRVFISSRNWKRPSRR